MKDFLFNNFIFNNITLLFLSTGLLITFFTLLSGWRKINNYKSLFLANIILFIFSFSIVISTKDWFIFIIGWEFVTLTTSVMLVWDDKYAAWEYFVIQFIGGSFLILTVLTAYTNGYQMIGPIEEFWLQLMFIVGLGIKSSIIGLHSWLPYIYEKASTTFCALSSGLTAKLGYITLLRIIADGNRLLLYLGIIMIFYGGIKALEKKSYKLILAYSSISQFGFITLAIGSGNIYGYYGAVLHIIAHSLAKSSLFNGAGNWFKEFDSDSIFCFTRCELRQKINSLSTTISFLSLMAFPFFIGYNSKYLIKYSLSSIPMFEFLLHLGSILTVAYVLKVLWIIIFKDLKESNFNFKTEIKCGYQPTLIENMSILFPALLIIILSLTINIFLEQSFEFNYFSGFLTTGVYLIVAYLIRFPIMSRINH